MPLLLSGPTHACAQDPFPFLRLMRGSSIVAMKDIGLANAGIIYARPGSDAAQLILDETAWRVQLMQNHPEIVPQLVPFAKAPFYANSDDQTLLNDVIVSELCHFYHSEGGKRLHAPGRARAARLAARLERGARLAQTHKLESVACAPSSLLWAMRNLRPPRVRTLVLKNAHRPCPRPKIRLK